MLKIKAKCPYEIGDWVQFERHGESHKMEITDIMAKVSTRTGYIKIILELDGWYKLDTDLHAADIRLIKNTERVPNLGTR